MTATLAELTRCGHCGELFDGATSGRPRSYCDNCPREVREARKRPSPAKRVGVEGEPFTLEHFRSWSSQLVLINGEFFELDAFETAFVEDLFAGISAGWLKEAWLVVPEGNGKSTLVAVLILYCVEFTKEASIPVAASARDQANIINAQATGFVRRSPGMAGQFVCKPGLREIVCGVSKAKIFASDAGTGDGIIPYPIEVIDELHRHKTLELYRTWAGKLDKEDAVLIVISTAGEPGSEFEDVRDDMRTSATTAEVDGCFGRYVGPTSLLHEYAVPAGADVDDLALVKAANPSSRITVETLAAKRARPSWSLRHWQRLTCNLPTSTVARAITPAEWAAAYTDERIPEGEPIDLGLDLGWKYDTTALAPLWIRDPEFRLLGPASILEPPRDGTQLDAHLVEDALLRTHERNPVQMVVMDMTNGEQLSQWIQEELGATVVDRTQGNALACMDYARFMEALREGWLHHTGDPGLASHVLNAVARLLPQGDTKFERPKESRTVRDELARRRVIDALIAASMVHTVASAALGRSEPAFAFG